LRAVLDRRASWRQQGFHGKGTPRRELRQSQAAMEARNPIAVPVGGQCGSLRTMAIPDQKIDAVADRQSDAMAIPVGGGPPERCRMRCRLRVEASLISIVLLVVV